MISKTVILCIIVSKYAMSDNTTDAVPYVSALFTPLQIRNLTLRNRICATSMSMYSSDDGMATDFHLAHLLSFALGGAALVMAESTAVSADGRMTPKDLGLWKDEQISGLTRIVKLIRKFGAIAGIQLSHAGRKGSCEVQWIGGESLSNEKGGWHTIAPSPLPYGQHIWKVPKEATVDDIDTVKRAFVSSAERAVRAGFQVIELQFGNGYLVHQFLSPVTNRRNDTYGGTFTNRMRLALEISRLVRQSIPESIVLAVRLSVSDFVHNGWDIPQTVELAKEFKSLNIDYMTCTSGLLVPNSDTNGMDKYAVQVPSAGLINKLSGIRTAAVGRIVSPKYAERIVTLNTASLVMIGRALLNNPHWPYEAADQLDAQRFVQYPKQYGYAIGDPDWRELLRIKGY